MRRKKGFTLVELLVVIAIIALLMGILMPALAQVRRLAQRMMCGTNLKGLGTAMNTYSNDFREEFPRAGRQRSHWSKTPLTNWDRTQIHQVWPDPVPASGHPATIGSCWYLLIKYVDATPKQFVCNGDQKTRPFVLGEHIDPSSSTLLTQVWDFGGQNPTNCNDAHPGSHYSYSYHYPFNFGGTGNSLNYRLTPASSPATPIAADRNPYLDVNAGNVDTAPFPSWRTPSGAAPYFHDPERMGNPVAHQREGMQVLFIDGHVDWERLPNCGIEKDHIYKYWPQAGEVTQRDKQFGGLAPYGKEIIGTNTIGPRAETDTWLVNEYNAK